MIHNKLKYHKVCMFLQQFIFSDFNNWNNSTLNKNNVNYDSLQNFNKLKKNKWIHEEMR